MSGPHTHGALIDFGDGRRAFVDGIPDECEHDYTGPSVFVTASGKVITWKTFPQWAGYTEAIRYQLIMFHFRDSEDEIVEHTCECRKCGKIYEPNFYTEEF